MSTESGRRCGEPRRLRSRYTLSTRPWCRVVLLVSSADDWNGVCERHRDYPQGTAPAARASSSSSCARLGHSQQSHSQDVDVGPFCFSFRQLFGQAASCRRGHAGAALAWLRAALTPTLAALKPLRSCQLLSTCPRCSMQGAARTDMLPSRAGMQGGAARRAQDTALLSALPAAHFFSGDTERMKRKKKKRKAVSFLFCLMVWK